MFYMNAMCVLAFTPDVPMERLQHTSDIYSTYILCLRHKRAFQQLIDFKMLNNLVTRIISCY